MKNVGTDKIAWMVQQHDECSVTTDATHNPRGLGQGWRGLAFIVVLFVILVLPLVIWPLNPQPDERRYSIAAAQMMATGDYLVPVTETGDLRLKKPPLTYYYIVAGFALLGQTLVGAKVFFLFSAGGIVILTYALGRALGASVVAANLGAAMLVGNRHFYTGSTQYIPDMPLVLGTTAALLGFVHVFRGTARPLHFYLAWFGIAWAVLAKGFLALLLVLVYVVVRQMRGAPEIGSQLRRHEAIAVSLAALVTLPWFALMAVWHFDVLVSQFVGDQVANKVQIDVQTVLAGIGKTTSVLFVLSLPGLLAIGLARAAAGHNAIQQGLRGPAVVFLLIWIFINVVIFAFSRQVYGRYALPAAPALMALAAAYATLLPVAALEIGLRRAMRILLPVLALIVIVGAVIGLVFGAVGSGVAGLIAAIVGIPLIWRGLAAQPLAIGIVAVALFFPGIHLAQLPIAHALIMPTEGQVAAMRIEQLDPSEPVLVVHRNAELVDRIGVELGDFARIDFAQTLPDPPGPSMIIFYNPDLLVPLERAGYMIDSVPVLHDVNIEPGVIAGLIASRDARLVREAAGTPLYFAMRP
jgi:4-amino-4-deoxy-L-arabinose transferase-like glycosyltransferase